MNRLDSVAYPEFPVLVAEAGRLFLGSPYVAHTLELPDAGGREQLVINLREMDCTTLAENSLALARTFRSGERTAERFAEELKRIRYRKGILDGYASRLHYFCDWILDNTEKGLVAELPPDGCRHVQGQVDFMSRHPGSYEALVRNPELIPLIAAREKELSSHLFCYYPEQSAARWMPALGEGDIVGICTDMQGNHVSHVGIILLEDGQIRMLHASSAAGKVVISSASLEEYLLAGRRTTGIMPVRPL